QEKEPEVLHVARRGDEDSGQDQPTPSASAAPAVPAIEPGGDEQREPRLDIAGAREIDHDRIAQEQGCGEPSHPRAGRKPPPPPPQGPAPRSPGSSGPGRRAPPRRAGTASPPRRGSR